MPTYQYVCTECGHDFETVQSFSDDALSLCPVCGGRLRKVFNSVGIVFKGSGFYRNDSREKAKSGASGSDSKSDTKSDSGVKSGAKADLKPDATPAGKTDAASTSSTKSGDSSSSGGGTKSKGPSSTTGSAA
ncbi:MAG: FmdB family zinc ribbon protein [Sporichthyaceae bacterium]